MPSADEADLRGSETTRHSVDPSELDSAYATGVFTGTGAPREAALAALHERLLRIARSELHRRSGHHRITGPELDDLAHQSADDALLAILAKLGQFRGESRFTTWAYGFVILEVSTKLGRHFWRPPGHGARRGRLGPDAGPFRTAARGARPPQ
jgi:RNA polymerase sigma-70 factor (ECF subfamily)